MTAKKQSAILHKSGMAFIKNNGRHIRWTCKHLCGIVLSQTTGKEKNYEYSSLLPCINRKGRSAKFP